MIRKNKKEYTNNLPFGLKINEKGKIKTTEKVEYEKNYQRKRSSGQKVTICREQEET